MGVLLLPNPTIYSVSHTKTNTTIVLFFACKFLIAKSVECFECKLVCMQFFDGKLY